jgi:hypothetical protein
MPCCNIIQNIVKYLNFRFKKFVNSRLSINNFFFKMYDFLLRDDFSVLRDDFSVSHETNSLPI